MRSLDNGQRLLMWIIIIGIAGLSALSAIATHASVSNIVKGSAAIIAGGLQLWLTDAGILGGGGAAGKDGKDPFWKLGYSIVLAMISALVGFAFLTDNI